MMMISRICRKTMYLLTFYNGHFVILSQYYCFQVTARVVNICEMLMMAGLSSFYLFCFLFIFPYLLSRNKFVYINIVYFNALPNLLRKFYYTFC